MLQVTPQTRIYLAVEFVDFRKGIDGLSFICQQKLKQDPFSGSLFLFRNRSGTSIKALIYDSQGFWICQKRFSKGRLKFWPVSTEISKRLTMSELQILLWNGNPKTAQIAPEWRKVG